MQKKQTSFKSKCLKPIWLKKQEIYVPCGQCPRCNRANAMGWIVRLTEELKIAQSAHFMTYTYEDTKIPYTKLAYPTLRPEDLTNYYKTLRNAHVKRYKTNVPIRYFSCGEYGTHTHRPHYHDIIMNADIDLIEQSWTHGKIFRGDVTPNSIGYVTGYILKGKRERPTGSDEILMFRRMSKGLGEAYIRNSTKKWHADDPVNRYYYPMQSGGKLSLPRYLKQKLFTSDDRESIAEFFHALAQADNNKYTAKEINDLYLSEQRRLSSLRDF